VTDAFATAAENSGADLVTVSTTSRDHALGSAAPWVTGFSMRMRPVPFHPNATGMQAVADAIMKHLEGTPTGHQ
jgi:hypothetical protein